jgi:hypothetical protein
VLEKVEELIGEVTEELEEQVEVMRAIISAQLRS